MKWKMVKKGKVWKRRIQFDVEDWICLTLIAGLAVIMIFLAIVRGM